jgi:hypothetical protein
MKENRRWVTLAVAALVAVQCLEIAITVHRESLTWDEGDHMYAGYCMWKNGDYGLNPEHPPLVKLLATLPVLHEKLWIPPKGNFRDFKEEAYLNGRDWLERNDGSSQRLVFRMRLMAGLLAVALSLLVFYVTREWFGTTAALVALTLAVFEPNILAHSGLVTTDLGAALFFLATVYAFSAYVIKPSWKRLLIAGITFGLLLATKHSGVLLGPMLLALVIGEIAVAPRGTRKLQTFRLGGGLAAMVLIAVAVLWLFYGFRYSARPSGLQLYPTLDEYSQSLHGIERGVISWMAHLRLLPESYLMGMADVRIAGRQMASSILGTWHPHGVWWYFPVTIAIKSTLGMLVLVLLAAFALVTGKSWKQPERKRVLVYVLFVWLAYLAIAMLGELNIGVRHILPLYPLAAVIAGAGVAELATRSRAWKWVCTGLIAAHIVSALIVFPDTLAYANEAWGGPRNVHNLLNDSNVDWARQLYQVKAWQDRHQGEDCWFDYTARPNIRPETYGVHCHILPNAWGAGAGDELVPPVIHGYVLLSSSELDGTGWPSVELNPYRQFQKREPDEEIDYGVLVYKGDFHMEGVRAISRAFQASDKLEANQTQDALKRAEEAEQMAPGNLFTEWSLGDAAAAAEKKDEARTAYNAAETASRKLDPERRADFVQQIEDSLKKL